MEVTAPRIRDGSQGAPQSRELLLAGPPPPLSQFGATLLRHVLVTALRYTLYQLGAAPPERSPVRIALLRPSLDEGTLGAALGGAATSEALLGALFDPGGTAPRAGPSGALPRGLTP